MLNTAYKIAGYPPKVDTVADLPKVFEPQEVSMLLKKNVKLISYALSFVPATYVFVLQPTMAVTKKKLTKREESGFSIWHPEQIKYFRSCYERIREDLSTIDVPDAEYFFHDLSGVFDQYPENDEIFLDAYHFGDRGNHIIASNIFKCVEPTIKRQIKEIMS